jgi:hypothetical protein
VKYLAATNQKDPSFMKSLVLAQLLGWAILGQLAGQRKSTASGSGFRALQSLRTGAEVGCHVLAFLRYRQRDLKTKDETARLLDELLEARGGVGVFVWVQDAVSLYQDAREAERELKYVYWIVSYLCRCKKHGLDASKFNIETAKEYLAQWAPEGKRTYGVSKIEKIWLKYENAAPYIFGFYSYLRGLRRDVAHQSGYWTRLRSLLQMSSF